MRKFSLFLLAVTSIIQLSAQQPSKKNTIYFEAGGNGLGLSVGFERQVGKKVGLGLHAGISLAGNKPGVVSGAKYLIGFGNHKSFLETGFGVTLSDREYIGAKQDTITYRNPYTPVFMPSIGYRHHTRYGLMWRVTYTSAFSKYKNLAFYPGISVGWIL